MRWKVGGWWKEPTKYGKPIPEPNEWRIGEVRIFERIKVRDEEGSHVADGWEMIGREEP